MDGNDIGMVEGRGGLRFAEQSISPARDIRPIGQHLNGDGSVEARVAGFMYLAHAARANLAENLVRTDRSGG